MISNPFEYQRAGSLQEAITQLKQHGDEAKLLAGGHSLIPTMKLRLNAPAVLIDLAGIDGLASIESDGNHIHIGAMATHRQVESSELVQSKCAALAAAAGGIGDPQVRNKGTIGGSLAHADPAADYPALVLALNASVSVQGPDNTRTIAADDFFTGMFDTDLEESEIITKVSFPVQTRETGAAYAKFPNPASRFAVVGVAAHLTLDGNGTCTAARIAITGAAPAVFRASAMENALTGTTLDDASIAAACAHTPDEDEMLSDLSGSAKYRAHLCGVMAQRAIKAAAADAKG
ncbi:MAG: xanthine dehydrogenase family protein subunit M [Rhodothermales bacterium]